MPREVLTLKEQVQRRIARELAKARELLESTRREDYQSTSVYARVVTQRLHKVRRLKRDLEERGG